MTTPPDSASGGGTAPAAEAPPAQAGPEHAIVKAEEGTWDATISMMTAPGAPPQTSKGVETCTLGCNGLWLITDFKGEMMGQPFHGHGLKGYDPDKKKYVGVWVDAWTTRLDISEGTYDAATKTLTSKVKGKDPGSGQEMEYTMKTVLQDKDNRYLAMLVPGPDGKPMEPFRITYKRKK